MAVVLYSLSLNNCKLFHRC